MRDRWPPFLVPPPPPSILRPLSPSLAAATAGCAAHTSYSYFAGNAAAKDQCDNLLGTGHATTLSERSSSATQCMCIEGYWRNGLLETTLEEACEPCRFCSAECFRAAWNTRHKVWHVEQRRLRALAEAAAAASR